MVLPDEQTPAVSGLWSSWNGRRLVWRGDVASSHCAEVELCIDGVIFERIVLNPATRLCERDFAFPPSGRAEMEFSLRRAGGAAIGSAWRVLHGQAASAGVGQWQGAVQAMQSLPVAPLPLRETASATAIVVPIYNSPSLVKRCIAAVLRWTNGAARLILIDDASSDPGINTLLAGYEGFANVIVRRNAQNLGYTRSTNLGIELAGDADVVLLNSDTEVGPRWLDGLRQAAYSDDSIGTVTAISDNAGAFSVPELEQACPIPSRWSLPMAQRAILQNAGGCLPELPTGNGFCMFVQRAMLDRVGVLDAAAFPSGYGEENDLCQRAGHAGFRHVIAGNVFVHHERSASFGEARRAALGAQGMQVLRSRYPDYEAKVGATLFSFARRVLDYRVRRIYADRDGVFAELPPRPRIMLAIGRVPLEDVVFLIRALSASCEYFVLHDEDGHLRVSRYQDAQFHLEQEHADAVDAGLVLSEWLLQFAIELVHLVSAQAGNADLRAAASRINVPVVDSSEDTRLHALQRGVFVENADSTHSAQYCNDLYATAWRDNASFAEAASST